MTDDSPYQQYFGFKRLNPDAILCIFSSRINGFAHVENFHGGFVKSTPSSTPFLGF
jgi:hypothetical protein